VRKEKIRRLKVTAFEELNGSDSHSLICYSDKEQQEDG